ncbi:MAG: hypothetical protein WA896_02360 [Spirulinaceae cyanobacterium]
MARSLKATSKGIERAKGALTERGLTQTALVKELEIASWSTINKFFNGKAVDRGIFITICETLGKDWEEIATEKPLQLNEEIIEKTKPLPQPYSSNHKNLKQKIDDYSIAAREALNPRILTRIERPVVREKYLRAIQRGLRGQQRIVPIIGPAGYGKSTILGNLYDLLKNNLPQQSISPGWLILSLCNSLDLNIASSPENLARSWGESVSGQNNSLLEIVTQLTAEYGKGVLLIDTIDLVVSRSFVNGFGGLLRQLLEQDVTVVFTCRDHEYNDFLEPTRTKLPGIASAIERHFVPEFSPAEVKQAASIFVKKQTHNLSDHQADFAEKILTLSADSRSLKEIVCNPLLLALLCDLFAKDGNVPPDLTVSKLYQRYWEEKIVYSRFDDSHSSLLALQKEKICLDIAQALFAMSVNKLCEAAYLDELGLELTETTATAYDDLLSEGVLEKLPSQKIHFFHQTLLEYAIAYWLTRHSSQSQRQQLLATLKDKENSHQYHHWWAVIRQHLTLVEDREFESLQQQLNLNDLAAFGAVAFAAASRERSVALAKLLPTALELGAVHQKRLRQALESAPRQLTEEVWQVVLALLEKSSHTVAVNTAKTVGALLAQWWQSFGSHWGEALAAIASRKIETVGKRNFDGRSELSGWLLQPCLPLMSSELQEEAPLHRREQILQTKRSKELLNTLRQYYQYFGQRTCIEVLQLYQLPVVPKDLQRKFLPQLLAEAVPQNKKLEAELTNFVAIVLPQEITVTDSLLGNSWLEVLHREYPLKVNIVVALAIGRNAAREPKILQEIMTDSLVGEPYHTGQNNAALTEALRQGAENFFTRFLITQPQEKVFPQRLSAMVSLLNHTSNYFSPANQESLIQWLQPVAEKHLEKFVPLLEDWGDSCKTAQQILQQGITRLPAVKQKKYQGAVIRFLPLQEHPPLNNLDKKSQFSLVKFYQQRASTSVVALNQLFLAVRSNSKNVAITASCELDQVAGDNLKVAQLLPLLDSSLAGVRNNIFQAWLNLSEGGATLTEEQVIEVCQILKQEDNQVVARPFYQLIACWTWTHKSVPDTLLKTIGAIPPRLRAKGTFEGGVTRTIIIAFRAIANTQAPNLMPHLGLWTRQILLSIDLIRVQNSGSEMTDLLVALDRLDKAFLSQLVTEDVAKLASQDWQHNVITIVRAIYRVESQSSPLLAEILASEWCPLVVQNAILEMLGA